MSNWQLVLIILELFWLINIVLLNTKRIILLLLNRINPMTWIHPLGTKISSPCDNRCIHFTFKSHGSSLKKCVLIGCKLFLRHMLKQLMLWNCIDQEIVCLCPRYCNCHIFALQSFPITFLRVEIPLDRNLRYKHFTRLCKQYGCFR